MRYSLLIYRIFSAILIIKMEFVVDIFLNVIFLIIAGGVWYGLLRLLGLFVKYSTVKGGHTFLTDRENL